MKTNKHYAMAMPSPRQAGVVNGLRPDQVGREGTDMFVQEERYLRAYASYFAPTLPADSFSTLVVKAPPGSGAR